MNDQITNRTHSDFWTKDGLLPDRMAPLPKLLQGWPEGWMSPLELQILYNLALAPVETVLEVGPWIGRSTTALCAGLRDGPRDQPAKFDVVDLGQTSAADWLRDFGVPLDFTLRHGRVAEAIYHPGGTIAVLINNLKRNDLLSITTTVTRGNFLDLNYSRMYDLIMCDAIHDEREASLYMPKISSLIKVGGTLVIDDVVTDEFADFICSFLEFNERLLINRHDKAHKLFLIKAA